MKVSEAQIRWFRLRRSGLVDPFASPEETASALVGVQAQILPAAALAIWNRTSNLTYETFGRQLYEKRSLVKLWGQRGTLHVYASREWPLIHAALQDQRTWWERLNEETSGKATEYRAAVAGVEKLLRSRGLLGRSDLRDAGFQLDEALFSSWGGIFAGLVRRGYACHARQEGSKGYFAHRQVWLPGLKWNPPPGDEANVEMIRRYLRAYGPASVQDMIYWRGRKAGDVRRWIAALSEETIEIDTGGRTMLALRADLETLCHKHPKRGTWPVRMLYRFDPLLLGIKDKTWIIDGEHYQRVFRTAGHIEGSLLDALRGRIAGTWRYDRKTNGLAIHLTLFAPLPASVRKTLEQQANRIAQFFGSPLADFSLDAGLEQKAAKP